MLLSATFILDPLHKTYSSLIRSDSLTSASPQPLLCSAACHSFDKVLTIDQIITEWKAASTWQQIKQKMAPLFIHLCCQYSSFSCMFFVCKSLHLTETEACFSSFGIIRHLIFGVKALTLLLLTDKFAQKHWGVIRCSHLQIQYCRWLLR